MSMLMRRRSRDAAWDGAETLSPDRLQTSVPKRAMTRPAFVLTTIISTLTIALVLLARFQQSAPLSPDLSVTENGKFTLHPEEHIFRQPMTIERKWRITSGMRRPDGVLKRVYLINDAFPGPTLEARPGDRMIIEVENALDDEELSIHWHGLSMRGANDMDGAAAITQAPIRAGEHFTCNFSLEEHQHGTFWWHSHHATQRADGLFGGLVVHKPSENRKEVAVNAEHLVTVGDWYHRTAEDALDFYMHPGSFGNEPVPDSILINSQGAFNCSNAVPARPLDCEQRTVPDLTPLRLDGGKSNILRIVNVGAYAGISVRLAGSLLTAIAVDGGNTVQGTPASSVGYIQPGERVDFLVQSLGNEGSSTTYLEVALDSGPFKISNPALTQVHQFPVKWSGEPTLSAKTQEQQVEHFDLEALKSKTSQSAYLPEKADMTVLLYAMTQKLSHLRNVPHGFINRTFWQPQESPPEPLISLQRDQWDKNQLVPNITYDSNKPLWVDIVLNNLDEEGHPFHLHGYDFWVLSKYSSTFNWGSYNPFEDISPPGGEYDLVNALKKDTVYVPRRGYVVLRLRADNPGLWMFHCHVMWHQSSGMAMAIEVG